jgi:hypothetical protein
LIRHSQPAEYFVNLVQAKELAGCEI